MKRNVKKLFASLFAGALMLSSFSLTALSASAEEAETETKGYNAYLMYADKNWVMDNWDAAKASTTVTGDGTYTVKLNAADVGAAADKAEGAMVFNVDIQNVISHLKDPDAVKVSDVKVLCDNTEVTVDQANVKYGNIEDDTDNFRIEIYNEYGDTAKASPIDKEAFTWKEGLEVQFTLAGIEWNENAFNTYLMYADNNWVMDNWDTAKACTTVTGDGSYTVKLARDQVGTAADAATGAMVFCVDIQDVFSRLGDADAVKVSDVKVLCDGAEVAVDQAGIVTGHLEEETDNYRIEIYNEYGDTVNASPIDKDAFTWKETLEVQFTLAGLAFADVAAAKPAEEVKVDPVDPNGTYHAYFGFQTPKWTFRNACDDATYGLGTENFDKVTAWDADNNAIYKDGTFTDAEIKGNGTYTVSFQDFDLAGEFDEQAFFNLLFVSTDIPNSGEITFSNVEIKMDGKSVYTFDDAFLDPDSKSLVKLLAANLWNADLAKGELFYYAIPAKSIEITFTVAGFAYDNDAAAAPAEAQPVSAPVDEAAPAASNMGLIVGIVVAVVVVVAAAAAVLVLKKKKTGKK